MENIFFEFPLSGLSGRPVAGHWPAGKIMHFQFFHRPVAGHWPIEKSVEKITKVHGYQAVSVG